jgi:hypothetical protein
LTVYFTENFHIHRITVNIYFFSVVQELGVANTPVETLVIKLRISNLYNTQRCSDVRVTKVRVLSAISANKRSVDVDG